MEEIFLEVLKVSHEKGVIESHGLHEFLYFPSGLIDIYLWTIRSEERGKMAVSEMGSGE
jgi:hypothetical protein